MNNVSAATVARLRAHPAATDTGHGWLVVADTNTLDKVYLVSKHNNTIVPFDHDKPYHSYMRAYCRARLFAQSQPQAAPVTTPELVFAPLFGLIT